MGCAGVGEFVPETNVIDAAEKAQGKTRNPFVAGDNGRTLC